MTRAEFIKNLGIFGTLLTVLGYKQALAIKDNDDVNVTNRMVFDLKFFTDRYADKHDCHKLVNNINDYFRSNKKPNFDQISESGKYFHSEWRRLEKILNKIGRGNSGISNVEQIDLIEDYICVCILLGKSYLLLGNGKQVSNTFWNANHQFIRMSKLNIGKKGNMFPNGLNERFYALTHKEMAETFIKTDFHHTDAIYYYQSMFDEQYKSSLKYISQKEMKRIRIVLDELMLKQYTFHPDDTIQLIKNNIKKYGDTMKPYSKK